MKNRFNKAEQGIVNIIQDLIELGHEFNLPVMETAEKQYKLEPTCFMQPEPDTCRLRKYQKVHYEMVNNWIPEVLKYGMINYNH